jgi:hypothetical protein
LSNFFDFPTSQFAVFATLRPFLFLNCFEVSADLLFPVDSVFRDAPQRSLGILRLVWARASPLKGLSRIGSHGERRALRFSMMVLSRRT